MVQGIVDSTVIIARCLIMAHFHVFSVTATSRFGPKAIIDDIH